MSTLRASVSAGVSGPVITLSGEVDITTAAELSVPGLRDWPDPPRRRQGCCMG